MGSVVGTGGENAGDTVVWLIINMIEITHNLFIGSQSDYENESFITL